MLVIGVVLTIGGAGALDVILPVLGCVLMIGMMMWMMRRSMSYARHHHSDRPGPRDR